MQEFTKICTDCGIEKRATSEYFNKDKAYKNGLRSICRECFKKRYRENRKIKKAQREKSQDNVRYVGKGGQFGVPQKLRDKLGWGKDQLVEMYMSDGHIVLKRYFHECNTCGKEVSFDSKFKICDSCIKELVECEG